MLQQLANTEQQSSLIELFVYFVTHYDIPMMVTTDTTNLVPLSLSLSFYHSGVLSFGELKKPRRDASYARLCSATVDCMLFIAMDSLVMHHLIFTIIIE